MALLTVKQAAEFLGLSMRTVYQYIKDGKIKAVKVGAGWRIKQDELNEIAEQGVEATAAAAADNEKMKIKKLYLMLSYPNDFILEALDGKLYRFYIGRARQIKEKDLTPLADGVKLKGNNAEEAPEHFYKIYGLEKEI